MRANSAIVETPTRFRALDGFSLAGVLFAPASIDLPPTAVILTCGGGVAAARYALFARFLAERGIPALTFDYRGIATSSPSSLRGFRVVAEDWAELDCGGAIAYLRSRYPEARIAGISHSIGAMMLAGAPNVAEITRFVFICAHTGYFGDYLPLYRLPMALLWHVIMPAITRIVGYFPAKVLRLGEDLPAGLALQWAARRSAELRPEATTKDAARARSMIARFNDVTGPALVVGFDDDAFATKAGTRRFLELFPRLRPEVVVIAPADVDMSQIGHFGFFRRGASERLWPIILSFLLRNGLSPLPAPTVPGR